MTGCVKFSKFQPASWEGFSLGKVVINTGCILEQLQIYGEIEELQFRCYKLQFDCLLISVVLRLFVSVKEKPTFQHSFVTVFKMVEGKTSPSVICVKFQSP